MKNIFKSLIFSILAVVVMSGCKKFLDINSDPDTTQQPSNSSVLPAMLSGIPRGLQYDFRYGSKYIQNLLSSANGNADTYDRHGYVSGSDANGDIWRQTYFGMGANLNYMIDNGIKKEQYDYVAVAYILKAFMFQITTDYHGDIIFSEAFKEGLYYFKYDSQLVVYQGVDSLCRVALTYLDKAAGSPVTMTNSDISYNGDLSKWRKLTYAILARNFNRYSNKSSMYKPDSVIKYADLSFTSVNDDFVIPFDATKNDDANFFGPYRNNLASYRQSNFIVKLLDGTTLTNAQVIQNRDPRIYHMLSASQDTTNGNGGYRGVDAGIGDPYSALTGVYTVGSTNWINARKRVANVWGDSLYVNPSASAFTLSAGKYLYKDKAVLPVITYAEIQFTKAEAAYRKGDKATAHTAYLAGINAHFDFINRNYGAVRGAANIYNGAPITAAQRASYLASENVKAQLQLTLSDIMLQKYIALWGWGFVETWVDLRRFHYNVDQEAGTPVYKNFAMPSAYTTANLNKPVQRVRPRYNSEYVWNYAELVRIGADKPDYHTYPVWFSIYN